MRKKFEKPPSPNVTLRDRLGSAGSTSSQGPYNSSTFDILLPTYNNALKRLPF